MNTRCAGAAGLFAKPNIRFPFVPSHTGSPAVAVEVSIPETNPSVTTLTRSLVTPPVSRRPRVLLDVASVALDALETIIFVPFAEVTYTA